VRRELSAFVVIAAFFALLLPSSAQAFRPEIVNAIATNDNEGIRFTVKVRMDRGGRAARDVNVTFGGVTKNADLVDQNRLSSYETGAYNAPVRDCYEIKVIAKNRDGTTRETVRAGRLGTDGCGR
jgi:hypothetical protein